LFNIVKWALTWVGESGINRRMTALKNKKNVAGGYRKTSNKVMSGSNLDKKDPVVNKSGFRDMFGLLSKFVQVGGDFV